MLIEIHILQNHAPSNLNRDDSGSPKSCTFGEVPRARISSQCLKRSVRRSEGFQTAMQGHLATRTRRMPNLIRQRFEAEETLRPFAEAAAQKASGFGTSDGKERPFNPKTGEYETAQTMFLTPADEDAVFEVLSAKARAAESVKSFAALKAADLQKEARQGKFRPLAVDVAMFGRMVTSEAFRDVEASTQVAHALSTHKVAREFDYFTAIDDLRGTSGDEEDAGADIIGDVEFNSACYYKYFSIHPDGLVDNLVGAEFRGEVAPEVRQAATELAARAVREFLRAAILVSPSGKQNTFAAHQLPYAVLVEVRPHALPVSYANAFVAPARAGGVKHLARDSFDKLAAHAQRLTEKFNLSCVARLSLVEEDECVFELKPGVPEIEVVPSLDALCARVEAAVLEPRVTSSNALPVEAARNGTALGSAAHG